MRGRGRCGRQACAPSRETSCPHGFRVAASPAEVAESRQ